ncbi:MAG: hypothetical protein AB8B57_06255 [Congregibacter sp.]
MLRFSLHQEWYGKPRPSIAKARHTMGRAWDELGDQLKPGMRFSEVSALGK